MYRDDPSANDDRVEAGRVVGVHPQTDFEALDLGDPVIAMNLDPATLRQPTRWV